jgi:uncharacterized protein
MNTAGVSAWHAGERLLQARVGVAAQMAEIGQRVLRDFMPEQHRQLFAELPLLVAGTLAADGQPEATLVAGPAGFAHAPTPQLLHIAADARWDEDVRSRLRVGAPIALLGLQAHTRRRNRLNGWVSAIGAHGVDITVGQSFGNCPKYIHPREALHAAASGAAQRSVSAGLSADALRIARGADTFFIATAHPGAADSQLRSEGVDVSHRGGPPGFVQVAPDGSLLVRDYVGNTFFNTLGNLQLEPRCGLLFVDYASGEQVQLACRARLLWERKPPEQAAATERLLRIEVLQTVRVRGGLPLRWV